MRIISKILASSIFCLLLSDIVSAGATFYGDRNITSLINQKPRRHIFFNIFHPECAFSKSLAPVYEDLAEAFEAHEKEIIFAKINGRKNPDIRVAFMTDSYPSLYFISKDGKSSDTYNGERDFNSLVTFIEAKTGLKATRKPRSRVIVLDSTNFETMVLNSNKSFLVNFYAPWCSYCQQLAPIYKRVAQAFSNEQNCAVAEVDATLSTELGKKYLNKVFPTILFFPGNNQPYEIYNGPREEKDIINYLNYKCKTHRAPGGFFKADVGKIRELEVITKTFAETASYKDREEMVKNATLIAEDHKSKYAKYYANVLQMILNGTEFLQTEKARIETIVAGDSISHQTKDDFFIRWNILNSIETHIQKQVNKQQSESSNSDL